MSEIDYGEMWHIADSDDTFRVSYQPDSERLVIANTASGEVDRIGRFGSIEAVEDTLAGWSAQHDDSGDLSWVLSRVLASQQRSAAAGDAQRLAGLSDVQRVEAEQFADQLNRVDAVPSWQAASSWGAELVDHTDLTGESDVASRFYLASGAIVAVNGAGDAEPERVWDDDRAVRVTAGKMERLHVPHASPDARVSPSATVHPTARVEPGATIENGAWVGEYAHVGRDARIGSAAVLASGAYVGAGAVVGVRSEVASGGVVGSHSHVGAGSRVGPGAQVRPGAYVDPGTRLQAGRSDNERRPQQSKAHAVGSAVRELMSLDR